MHRNKAFVIDACIANSAGMSEHPISSSCRIFLEEFRLSEHIMLMSESLRKEWDKHQSKFALKWRASMVARKRVKRVEDSSSFQALISDSELDKGVRDACLKDSHLIEISILGDKIIISRDDKVRRHFWELAEHFNVLKEIVWLNPSNPDEGVIDWLKAGSKISKEMQLGYWGREGMQQAASEKEK